MPYALETSFSVGLQGLSSEKEAEFVEKTVLDVLKRVAEEGFPKDHVDAYVHQVELGIKHVRLG